MSIRTAQPAAPGAIEACMMALAEGVLVTDPRSGLGLGGADGARTPVVWPARYSAVRVDGVVHLLDDNGQLVAREGDRIRLGGGFGGDEFWYACAGIEVVG